MKGLGFRELKGMVSGAPAHSLSDSGACLDRPVALAGDHSLRQRLHPEK